MSNETEYYEQFGSMSCADVGDKPTFSDASEEPGISDIGDQSGFSVAGDKPGFSDEEKSDVAGN